MWELLFGSGDDTIHCRLESLPVAGVSSCGCKVLEAEYWETIRVGEDTALNIF